MFNVPSFFGFRSGSYGIPVPPLLDLYPGAAAAYSLRLLDTSYLGSAIQVRNSSNVALDIGFTPSGNLDIAALFAHCGGGDGFVTEWYDQSGNGYDATQSLVLNQPQIVSSGSVIRDNGKPSLQFNGSMVLNTGVLVYTTNVVFGTAVASENNTNNNSSVISQTGTNIGRSVLIGVNDQIPKKSTYFFNNGTSYANSSSGTIVNNTQTLMTNYSFSNNYYNALNGGLGNNVVSGQSFTPSSTFGFSIGGQSNLFNMWIGKISEAVVWNSDQSSNKSGIETNINDFYNIYP